MADDEVEDTPAPAEPVEEVEMSVLDALKEVSDVTAPAQPKKSKCCF
jgi:hypothetical protein